MKEESGKRGKNKNKEKKKRIRKYKENINTYES